MKWTIISLGASFVSLLASLPFLRIHFTSDSQMFSGVSETFIWLGVALPLLLVAVIAAFFASEVVWAWLGVGVAILPVGSLFLWGSFLESTHYCLNVSNNSDHQITVEQIGTWKNLSVLARDSMDREFMRPLPRTLEIGWRVDDGPLQQTTVPVKMGQYDDKEPRHINWISATFFEGRWIVEGNNYTFQCRRY